MALHWAPSSLLGDLPWRYTGLHPLFWATYLGVTLWTALLAATEPALDARLPEQVAAAQRGDPVLARVGPRLETDGAGLTVLRARRANVRTGQEPYSGATTERSQDLRRKIAENVCMRERESGVKRYCDGLTLPW